MDITEIANIIQTVNRPVAFPGTQEERNANRETHHMVQWSYDDAPECTDCCARSYHVAFDYPCGQEPPRETITFYDDGSETVVPEEIESFFAS